MARPLVGARLFELAGVSRVIPGVVLDQSGESK